MKNIDKYVQTKNRFPLNYNQRNSNNNTPEEKAINKVLKSLLKKEHYSPSYTVHLIKLNYLQDNAKNIRIMYSVISGSILSGKYKYDTLYQNVEKLRVFVLDSKNDVDADCRRIAFKLYDHILLVLAQSDKFDEIYKKTLSAQETIEIYKDDIEKIEEKIKLQGESFKEYVDEMTNIKDETKGMQKEYISILGIFSAVVLIFVSSLLFTNGVIQNIKDVNIFRLILVIDVLALFLLNINYLMFKFIWYLQRRDKDSKFIEIIGINRCLIVILSIMLIIEICMA